MFLIISIILLFVNKHFAYFEIPFFSVPTGCVRIDFVNKSSNKIKLIRIINGRNSQFLKPNIEIGEKCTIVFKCSGEGIYKLNIEFESGRKYDVDERYIESGYYNKELIYDREVVTIY